MTPRSMPVKCDSTPSDAATAPCRAGSPTISGSRPTRTSTNITATARMNAVIWLRLDLQRHAQPDHRVHHRDGEDERGDLVPRDAGGPEADARQPGDQE